MRLAALSPRLQKLAARAAGRPHVHALIPALPEPWPPRMSLDRLERMHQALGALQADLAPPQGQVAPTLAQSMLPLVLRRDAVLSGRIEGTRTELEDLLSAEATGAAPDADGLVTANAARAIEAGLRAVEAGASVDMVLLRQLHGQLFAGLRADAGQLRSVQNWIGGARIEDASLVPPPPERVAGLLDGLDALLQQERTAHLAAPVPVLLGAAHAHLEAIHPFADGNGRIGRAMLPLLLAERGYPPVAIAGFLDRNRQEYFRLLHAAQTREAWSPWLDFVATAIEQSAQAQRARAALLGTIAADWRERTAGLRADSAARRALDILIVDPVQTPSGLAGKLATSFRAANGALAALAGAGIVREASGRQRDRVFVADGALEAASLPDDRLAERLAEQRAHRFAADASHDSMSRTRRPHG